MSDPPIVPDYSLPDLNTTEPILGIGLMCAGFTADKAACGWFQLRMMDGSSRMFCGSPNELAVLAKDLSTLVRMTDHNMIEFIRAQEMGERWDPPPQPKPWTRPARPPRGDAHVEMIYMAAGRCLVIWEEIETSLMRLWALFSRLPETVRETYAAYERLPGSQARVDDTARAGEGFYPSWPSQDLEGQVSRILAEIQEFLARRNDVAHGLSSYLRNSGDEEDGWYLTPSVYMSKNFDDADQGVYAYSSVELNFIAHHFSRLRFALHDLVVEVRAIAQKNCSA